MDELDFSAPKQPQPAAAAPPPRSTVQPTVRSPLYNPQLALAFFRSAGTIEQKPGGKPIFAQDEKYGGLFGKAARMYLLLEGDVGLVIAGKFLGGIKPGQIFGELAVIAGLPRSATALAKTDCKVISMDEKQFYTALQKQPDFALMLMSIMVDRLRQSISKLGSVGAGETGPADRSAALDKKMLAELPKELGGQHAVEYAQGKVIMSAGASGALMYVVTKGRVAITVGDKVVERVSAGGIFGEMALVDRATRTATATAEIDSELLAVGRNDFLDLVKSKPMFGASMLKSIAERMQHLAQQVAKLPG
jgi:CRP/FNR family cyclic AMP-dependent transcriptional regulator